MSRKEPLERIITKVEDVKYIVNNWIHGEPCAEDSSGLDEYCEELRKNHYDYFVSKGYIVDLDPPDVLPTR